MSSTSCNFDDASLLSDEPAMIDTTESISSAFVGEEKEDEEVSLGGVGKMIQDLFCSDNAKVNAALNALNPDFCKDKEKCDTVAAWGGCAALVHLLTDCLEKAMKKAPASAQVSELHELAELTTLQKTLIAIINLTYGSEMGKVGITTVGGVEAAVKVMKTFPKCQALQQHACSALSNLARYSIGKEKTIEAGGIEVLLAAVINHLDSEFVCENACCALFNIADGSKKNTWLLINLGGGATVVKVSTKWPDNYDTRVRVQNLAHLFAAEWKAWSNKL
jgi:hypothetical protein